MFKYSLHGHFQPTKPHGNAFSAGAFAIFKTQCRAFLPVRVNGPLR